MEPFRAQEKAEFTEPIDNPWTVSVYRDDILIRVADSSGKCLAAYQSEISGMAFNHLHA